MKLEEYYNIGELLQLREESAPNEFSPKFGNGARRTSGDNDKAVKEILKNTEELNKGVKKEDPKPIGNDPFIDPNKTPLDGRFAYDPGDAWKNRVKSQVAGYPSEYNKEHNGYDESLEFDGNEKFYDARKQMSNEINKNLEDVKKSGLAARVRDVDYSTKTGFVSESNQRKIKRVKLKNTIFLDESHVLSKVPEDYKIDENRFYMQDKTGTDYLVECKADPFGYVHMEVVNKFNKKTINEELEKMRRLAGYKYSDDNKKVDVENLEDMSESISNFRKNLNK